MFFGREDVPKKGISRNPSSKIVKGAGKEAVRNQRDAERAHLKEMIQAGRRAKVEEPPVVIECLEDIEGDEDREAEKSNEASAIIPEKKHKQTPSTAWAATLGKSTVTMEDDTEVDVESIDNDCIGNNDTKISLTSVTKEQLDVDEVVELDDSEGEDEDDDDDDDDADDDVEMLKEMDNDDGDDNDDDNDDDDPIADLDADMNVDTVEAQEYDSSIEIGEVVAAPTPEQTAIDLADMQDLVECMKVAADVAGRDDLDDFDDDEFEEEDSDEDADNAIQGDGEAIEAWIQADNGDLSKEDIDFFAEEGVDVSLHDGEVDDAVDKIEDTDIGNENVQGCPAYATIDPYPSSTAKTVVEQQHHEIQQDEEFESVDEWSQGDYDGEDDEGDPLQKPTNLSQNQDLKSEAMKLQIYLNENLGTESVAEVIYLLENIDSASSEEVLLAEVEKVIGVQGLFYLDDFFKLLTCLPAH